MRVLVVGSGGREHAIVRALAADPEVTGLHAAPGNPGIGELAERHAVAPADPVSVTALARRTGADLVVIGPEAPLVAGVADAVRAAGIDCFGPGQGAAMIEGSKSFAKQVMVAAGIPTAAARTCQSEAEAAAALDAFGAPYVVKADGLAAGKGVVVTDDRAAALRHAGQCVARRRDGGHRGVPRRPRGVGVRPGRRRDRDPAAAGPGLQARLRRRQRAEHRRHGRLRPPLA